MCCAELANTTLVSKTIENGSKTTSDGKTSKDTSPSLKFSRRVTHSSQKVGSYDLSCIQESLIKKSLSTDSQDIILASFIEERNLKTVPYLNQEVDRILLKHRNTLPRSLHRSGY